MQYYDSNYLFFTPLIILFVAVAVFLAGWLPVYLLIMKLLELITGFFKRAPSRNILQIR
jgi:hypothetical protein